MNYTQNHKITQASERTLVVGVGIESEQHHTRDFGRREPKLTWKGTIF